MNIYEYILSLQMNLHVTPQLYFTVKKYKTQLWEHNFKPQFQVFKMVL